MIAVHCHKCGEELTEPGALVFSPPDPPDGRVQKLHICAPCWSELTDDGPDMVNLNEVIFG